jgi:23S rRNA (pseudouridine1915-N3)-methyltransferase
MNLHILALGKGMPDWVSTAFDSYQKRLPSDCALHLKELKAVDRAGNANVANILAKEAEQLIAATPKGALRVVLDERGKDLTTVALSQHLTRWLADGRDVVFYIGSADGLDAQLKQTADLGIRLSSLTLPHMMVRVLLAEQLYRAWSILNNHPYHRV